MFPDNPFDIVYAKEGEGGLISAPSTIIANNI